MRILSALILIAAFIIFNSTHDASAATVIKSNVEFGCYIALNGAIDKRTDIDLATAYNSFDKDKLDNCGTAILILNSNGGDVDAAIRAGNFVREKNMTTTVFGPESCASACVLIFLGGVNRNIVGKSARIGLHRPYSVNYSDSTAAAKDSYEKINHQVRQYLDRMNIPDNLLNIMNSVPPAEVKWLTRKYDYNQLKALFIVGKDPVWEEQHDSMEAKKLGITKAELYSRRSKQNAKAGNFGEELDAILEDQCYDMKQMKWGNCQ